MTQPTAHSIPHHFIRDVEHIAGTNDLWLAQATRAVKAPGKGDYMLVLIGPRTQNAHGRTPPTKLEPGYVLRGYVKPWQFDRFKIDVHSPVPDQHFGRWHAGTLYASDYATARRLLIVLAKELVYDRP